MKSPTLPAPAMATRISAPVPARADRAARRARDTSATKCRMSPSWPIALGVLDLRGAEAGDRDEPEHARARSAPASFLPAHAGGIG